MLESMTSTLHLARLGRTGFFFLTGFVSLGSAAEPKSTGPNLSPAEIRIAQTNYHGWPGAWTISNGKVEAIVVPAIGRIMQFKFVDAVDGPFWENRAMDGKLPDPQAKDWGNFGGDKTW